MLKNYGCQLIFQKIVLGLLKAEAKDENVFTGGFCQCHLDLFKVDAINFSRSLESMGSQNSLKKSLWT